MQKIGWIMCATVAFSGAANAQEYVRGHYRSSNAFSSPRYVEPHYRSSRDHSFNNNWSVRPNVNPYTGNRGSLSPTWNDRAPSRSSFQASPYNSSFRSGFGR